MEFLIAGSKEAEVSIGDGNPDFDLTALAVKNLGFIEVAWLPFGDLERRTRVIKRWLTN